MDRLGVLAGVDHDRRGRLLVDVGGQDLALGVGDLVQLDLKLLEAGLVAALHEQGDAVEGAGDDELLCERLYLAQDRLVASQERYLGLSAAV